MQWIPFLFFYLSFIIITYLFLCTQTHTIFCFFLHRYPVYTRPTLTFITLLLYLVKIFFFFHWITIQQIARLCANWFVVIVRVKVNCISFMTITKFIHSLLVVQKKKSIANYYNNVCVKVVRVLNFCLFLDTRKFFRRHDHLRRGKTNQFSSLFQRFKFHLHNYLCSQYVQKTKNWAIKPLIDFNKISASIL